MTPQSALVRQLGVLSATALVVSNMVGTGIFTTTGFLAGGLGSPGLVLLIWVAGAFSALAGALCYSEMGVNFPSSGGEYVYLTEAYGPTWGFLSGWVSLFGGFSAPIAAAALAFSDYLGYFFPALKQQNAPWSLGSGDWALRLGGAQIVASGLIVLFTLLNLFGVRRTARVQNALTASKLLVIGAFILLGLLAGNGSWTHFHMAAARTSTRPAWAEFAVSLLFIYVSYSGWNAATYVAEELNQPQRTLPLALFYGTTVVAALFVLLNIVFIYAVPLESMKGVVAVGSLAAAHLFGPKVAGLFSAAMALSLLATVNAMVTIGPRTYYAMAKNGAFFASAARVDPRWHTPVVAILCQGVCSVLMTLTPFQNLLFYIGFLLNFFTVMAVSGLFRFRKRPGWRPLRAVSFAWPLIPVCFLAVGIWITLFGMTLKPAVSISAILTIAAGAAVYRARLFRF